MTLLEREALFFNLEAACEGSRTPVSAALTFKPVVGVVGSDDDDSKGEVCNLEMQFCRAFT